MTSGPNFSAFAGGAALLAGHDTRPIVDPDAKIHAVPAFEDGR